MSGKNPEKKIVKIAPNEMDVRQFVQAALALTGDAETPAAKALIQKEESSIQYKIVETEAGEPKEPSEPLEPSSPDVVVGC